MTFKMTGAGISIIVGVFIYFSAKYIYERFF